MESGSGVLINWENEILKLSGTKMNKMRKYFYLNAVITIIYFLMIVMLVVNGFINHTRENYIGDKIYAVYFLTIIIIFLLIDSCKRLVRNYSLVFESYKLDKNDEIEVIKSLKRPVIVSAVVIVYVLIQVIIALFKQL